MALIIVANLAKLYELSRNEGVDIDELMLCALAQGYAERQKKDRYKV